MQQDGVVKHEAAEVFGIDQATLQEFVRFRNDALRIDHVPVAYVRRKHRLELGALTIEALVEGDRYHPVICLAAKEEVGYEAFVDITLGLDSAAGVLIDVMRSLLPAVTPEVALAADNFLKLHPMQVITMAGDQCSEPFGIQQGRVQIGVQCLCIALLPMLEHLVVEGRCPTHPTLHEGDVQLGKSFGNTT